MQQPAIQDFYPDDLAHCYGCGRLNEHGLHVRSAWDGEETVAVLTPRPYHTAIGSGYAANRTAVGNCLGMFRNCTHGRASPAHSRAGEGRAASPGELMDSSPQEKPQAESSPRR
jgi:hypothetical protein